MGELIKSENGVSIYKQGKMLHLYIEEMKVMEIDEQFKSMLDKSYDNLVKLRKKDT